MNKKARFYSVAAFVIMIAAGVSAQNTARTALNKDLQDLAATERAFAATAAKEGFRDSFIKFFADDGIGFAPQPQRTREVLLKSPAPAAPRTIVFNWQPMFGDISLAGDLGYTTGPVLYTDVTENPKPPRHGMFFSVWQKQADGTWKVVVDMGSSMPQAVALLEVAFTPAKRDNTFAIAGTPDASYTNLDERLSADIEKHGILKAYQSQLNDEFRLHRSGNLPIVSKDALVKYFETKDQKIAYKFIGGKVAKSNDLAFSYGSFQNPVATMAIDSSIDGYYVHVWRKDGSGQWKLVADVVSELQKK